MLLDDISDCAVTVRWLIDGCPFFSVFLFSWLDASRSRGNFHARIFNFSSCYFHLVRFLRRVSVYCGRIEMKEILFAPIGSDRGSRIERRSESFALILRPQESSVRARLLSNDWLCLVRCVSFHLFLSAFPKNYIYMLPFAFSTRFDFRILSFVPVLLFFFSF